MKPLPLNLASRPFRNNLLVGSLLALAGIALVGGTAFNLYVYLSYGASYATLQHAQAEDRARIAELQKQERSLQAEIRTRDFRSAYGRGKLASELIRKSAFSWTQLFNTLETVVPPDVVLAAIRPNISSDGIVLRLEGVAKSHLALLTLEEKLQGHDQFKRVAPVSERKLNPSMPDITFLVTCDYIPPQPAAPVVTAANEGAPAGGNADAAGQGAAGQGVDTAVTAVGTSKPGGAAAASSKSMAAGVVVGRDGRPKTDAVSIIAPGGLLIAEAQAAPSKGKKTVRGAALSTLAEAVPAMTQATATPTAGTNPNAAANPAVNNPATPDPAAARTAGAVTAPAASGAAPATTTGPSGRTRLFGPKTDGSPAAKAGGQPAGTTPAPGTPGAAPAPGTPGTDAGGQRPIAAPRGYDPNVPRTMPANLAATAAKPKPPAAPGRAERLDVPLIFVARPSAEVYRTLAQAHGVRIDLDPTVDPSAPVTINLQGRKLEEALLLLSGVLRNQMSHPAEGIYIITSNEVRPPGAEAPPVVEEPIVEGGQR